MSILSKHLKRTRTRQSDFATEIGVEQGTVSKLANDKLVPTLELAWKIEKATSGDVSVYSWLDQNEVEQFFEGKSLQSAIQQVDAA